MTFCSTADFTKTLTIIRFSNSAGNTAMPLNQLIENVASIIEAAPLKMPRKWANVRSISIKTSDSMALPVYNKVPEEIAEIAKLAGVEVECDSEILAIEEARAKKDIAAKKKRKANSNNAHCESENMGLNEISLKSKIMNRIENAVYSSISSPSTLKS